MCQSSWIALTNVGSCHSSWLVPIFLDRTNPFLVRSHQSCSLTSVLLAHASPVGSHQSCWPAPILLARTNPVGSCQSCWLVPTLLAHVSMIQFDPIFVCTTHNSVARSLIAHCRCLGVALAQLIKHVLLCVANMFPPGDTDNHLVHA